LHDALAFEDRGIPAVLLCTEPFMDSAREHARVYGNPDYQAVSVMHPVASLLPEAVRQRADAALEKIIVTLTGRPALAPSPGH
jgi:hypothetical protein